MSLGDLFKKLLREQAAAEFQDSTLGHMMTYREVIARDIVFRAAGGNQTAQEFVVDRTEGKAGRAAEAKPADTTIDDQITRAEIEALNALTGKDSVNVPLR